MAVTITETTPSRPRTFMVELELTATELGQLRTILGRQVVLYTTYNALADACYKLGVVAQDVDVR